MNTHEETLKIARELIKKDPSLTDWVISKFPELQESEDERIRKALIDFFKRGAENGEQTNGICDKDILAWLEKQGNQITPVVNERACLHLVADVLTWKDGIGQYLDDPLVQNLAKKLCSEYVQKLYNLVDSIESEECFTISRHNHWWTDEKVYPATKEQYDLLFQIMKEEGYKWDAEKKELKYVGRKAVE